MNTYNGIIKIHNKDVKYAESVRDLVNKSDLKPFVTMWGDTVEIHFNNLVFVKGDYLFDTALSQLIKSLKKKANASDMEVDIYAYNNTNQSERVICHYKMVDGKLKTSTQKKTVFFDYHDCL